MKPSKTKSQIKMIQTGRAIFGGLFLVAVLVGCANSNSGGSNGSGGSPGGNPDPQPQAEEFGYYQSLLSSQEGQCDDAEGIRFMAVGLGSGVKLGTTPEGHDLVVRAELHLLADKTFALDYVEEAHSRQRTGSQIVGTIFSERITGQWRIEGESQLILEDLGTGNKLQLGERKLIQFKFKKRLNDARLVSPFFKFQKQQVAFGPQGQTAVEACQK
jgi:hypothetical protein